MVGDRKRELNAVPQRAIAHGCLLACGPPRRLLKKGSDPLLEGRTHQCLPRAILNTVPQPAQWHVSRERSGREGGSRGENQNGCGVERALLRPCFVFRLL